MGSEDVPGPAGARRALRLVALSLVALSLAWDHVGLGDPASGFGLAQLALLIAGLGLVLASVALSGQRLSRLVLRPLLLVASAYAALLLGEVVVAATRPAPRVSGRVAGLCTSDPWAGYRLTPGFHGVDDDGIVRVEYQTNSLGHRDREPDDAGETRLLLLGDSYAFGLRLGADECIDRHIERLSACRVDAYNAGVQGYGPASILATLERCTWFAGDAVVYCFYPNDLETSALDAGAFTTYDGWVVKARHPDGSPIADEEHAAFLRDRLAPSLARRVRRLLLLDALRELVLGRFRTPVAPVVPPENVARAVDLTLQMAALSRQRALRFLVVVIPSLAELRAGRHQQAVAAYMDGLRDAGIDVLEPLPTMTPQHYFVDEGHLDGKGAEQIARVTLEALLGDG